ncbi:MAG: YdcF family protein [Nitrospira sp.]
MDLSPFLFGVYKLVKVAVFPYTWLCAVTASLVVLAWLPDSPSRLRWRRGLAVAAAGIVWIVGSPLTATLLAGFLESRLPSFDHTTTAKFDAIVVLGGGAAGKGSLRPDDELGGVSLQRTLCGVALFAEGRAPRLVFSGGDAAIFGTGPREAVAMKRVALQAGVPDQAIVLDDRARNTVENARGVTRVLGQGSVVLVTSASHMLRATALFRAQGLAVTPAPCAYSVTNWPAFWEDLDPFAVIPSLGALSGVTNTLVEMVGLATAWMTGAI